jgi:nucleoside-diphosphate-sugar epimerase
VTGASSGLGHALARRLVDAPGVGRVIALDAARGSVPGATWRIADVTDPSVATRLTGADVVVHCALDTSLDTPAAERTHHNMRGSQAVLTAAAACGVRRVVLVTSAMVYGAAPDNPLPLDEDAPLRAMPDATLVGDYLEIERLAERARATHPGLAVTVVRPAALVGPGVDTVLTRHFESPRLLVVRDTRPAWQFCHVDDLVEALVLAATGAAEGVLTAGCEGWLEQAEVEAISGMRHIELPATVAFGTAERLHRLGLVPAPATDLQYVVHPWAVPSTRLRAAGWRPVYDNETALGALLEQVGGRHAVGARRVGRKDATIGAAGAAVAMVGTAALVRRARRRRHG